MNRNYIFGFAAAAALIAILAFAAWALFEIKPVSKRVPPSREARLNEYLALDRWLQNNGISVRIESSGKPSSIYNAAERNIFIQASLFTWNDDAVNYIINWVEEGGNLYLYLDYQTTPVNSYSSGEHDWVFTDKEPFRLLEAFGITAESKKSNYHYDGNSPAYDRNVSFETADEDALILKDWYGIARFVQVKRGAGKFAVSGRPRFLLSSNLDEAPNARLASAIFLANNGEPSWFFIRGTAKIQGLFGSLWRQGNLTVLLVSLLVLLIICFWTVIPMFGLVREDDEKPGKALRERFLAEGRFYKRYGALDVYRNAYLKEIKRKLAQKEGLLDKDEIEKQLNLTEHYTHAEFPKMIIILKNILESI